MRSRMSPCLFLVAAAVLLTIPALGQELPGIRPDGATLLPNGWSLRPHGDQLALEPDLPVRMEWHPAGRYLAIQHAGYRAHRATCAFCRDCRGDGIGLPILRIYR